MLNVLKITALVFLLVGLAGCFKSGKELIRADNAVFPFKTLTYVDAGGDDKITLERVGDKYLNIGEKDGVYVRLKALGENVFVAQISAPDTKGPMHLYGLIKVSPDRKSFEIIRGYAGSSDLAAVRAGTPGLFVCDDDSVCISALENYIDYAQAAPPEESQSQFQILKLE
ncbi:MAG: hypothetical protein ACTSY1_07645 [Alphaproteobacteria bacterium]